MVSRLTHHRSYHRQYSLAVEAMVSKVVAGLVCNLRHPPASLINWNASRVPESLEPHTPSCCCCPFVLLSQSLDFYRSRMNDPYTMGYFASSKVFVVNEGIGVLPRLEVHAVNIENNLLFLQAMQMFLGTGHITGTPAAAVMMIEDPGALREILTKYVLPDPFGMKKAAAKALKALKTAATGAGASSVEAASNLGTSTTRSTPTGSGSSSSTQHPSTSSGVATVTPKASDTPGSSTEANAAAADIQRDQHKHICAGCGGKGEKRCSVCRTTWYCGVDCQKADWAQHKKSCKPKA